MIRLKCILNIRLKKTNVGTVDFQFGFSTQYGAFIPYDFAGGCSW